jgi:quercetin dioxygenase-like cupin family protein
MMAKAGDILEHPVTGEKIIFRKTAQDTGGELMQADVIMRLHGFVAAEHIHRIQEERFEVLSGSVKFRIRGVKREVHASEIAVVPPGTPHVWWNDGDQAAHVLVDVRPALRFDEFFETFFGLAQAGKVSKKTGLPNLLVLALVIREGALSGATASSRAKSPFRFTCAGWTFAWVSRALYLSAMKSANR